MERFLKSRYRIGQKIGESPYCVSYQGTFLANDTPLIIKIYKRGTLNSALIQTMKQKVKELETLEHSNIAKLYDGDYGWQGFYYVRQYIKGSSLKDLLLIRKKLEPDYAVSLMFSICQAIAETHRRGIVHGALKPTNIFVDQKNVVKVTDFVIEGDIKESLPQKASLVLTDKSYISPEELLGCSSTFASDTFVLGLVLYEMLTGQVYFSADKNYFSALKQLKVISYAPKYLNDILYKALQEDPLLRFPSIIDFEKSLQEKSVITHKKPLDLPMIELEDMERPEVSEMKVARAETKRSFRLLFLIILSIIAGLVYAVLSLRF